MELAVAGSTPVGHPKNKRWLCEEPSFVFLGVCTGIGQRRGSGEHLVSRVGMSGADSKPRVLKSRIAACELPIRHPDRNDVEFARPERRFFRFGGGLTYPYVHM